MTRCLITGASGFVGANLARRLVRDAHETHVLLRREHQPWRLQEIASLLKVHTIDLTDRERVREAVKSIRPEWVFHLAAYGAYPHQNNLAYMADVNLMGAATLLDACVEAGVGAFIYTGSSSEYGYKDHAAREDEILEPNSFYGITKAAGSHYCQLAARAAGINAVAVRLYSIYGPYEEPTRLIPTLIAYGLHGTLPPLVSPATARDLVYVDDAVEGLICVARACLASTSPPRGCVYNLCTGVQTTLASVVDTARELMGITVQPIWSSMERRSWDTDIWVGCPTALATDIGWRFTTDFATGLQRTIDWNRTRQ